MSRNLATIQTIKTLDKIEGKDRILYASFEDVGFRVIVSADTKVGDRVIYCEVDSLLPVRPEFEFLRSRCYNEKWNGFRIRNMKMAGLYSEGIVFPLDIMLTSPLKYKSDGTDLTAALGITKYDPELLEEQSLVSHKKKTWLQTLAYRYKWIGFLWNFFKPKTRYSWPKWASKSDETRAQNLGYIFENYQNEEFVTTEKIDGQSCLFGIHKRKFYVCSRNLCLKDPKKGGQKNNYWEFAHENDVKKRIEAMRKHLKEDFYLQGELAGPGIQGNKYSFDRRRLFVFNIRFIKSKKYLGWHQMSTLCSKFGFEVVPIRDSFVWRFQNMEELLRYADGPSIFGHNVLREGVVIRSWFPDSPDRGQANMKSFKVISPSFDLKWNSK